MNNTLNRWGQLCGGGDIGITIKSDMGLPKV